METEYRAAIFNARHMVIAYTYGDGQFLLQQPFLYPPIGDSLPKLLCVKIEGNWFIPFLFHSNHLPPYIVDIISWFESAVNKLWQNYSVLCVRR